MGCVQIDWTDVAARSCHVMFCYHAALLFRVFAWGLVCLEFFYHFFKAISNSCTEVGTRIMSCKLTSWKGHWWVNRIAKESMDYHFLPMCQMDVLWELKQRSAPMTPTSAHHQRSQNQVSSQAAIIDFFARSGLPVACLNTFKPSFRLRFLIWHAKRGNFPNGSEIRQQARRAWLETNGYRSCPVGSEITTAEAWQIRSDFMWHVVSRATSPQQVAHAKISCPHQRCKNESTWSKEGRKEARKEARRAGRKEGRQEGRKAGRKEGRQEGMEEGSKEARK